MELKYLNFVVLLRKLVRLNRTFMELKYSLVKKIAQTSWFKSHLYGIEIDKHHQQSEQGSV